MPRIKLRFEPYETAGEYPNVIVDGTPTRNTTLTLSHWPGSPPVPADVQADLSAEMAFRYLEHPTSLHGQASVVSNNHFDQDGTVSIFALVEPDEALLRRPFLEDVAAAGDFATYRFRDAARVSMVLSALSMNETSPFAPLPETYEQRSGFLYSEVLGRFCEPVDHVDRYEELWRDEDADLNASEAAIADGTVTIEEHPDVDVAVVTVDGGGRWAGHRFGGQHYDGVHPMAIHNATTCSGILLNADGNYRFTYRYETWVQYRSRRLAQRVDLGPLAEELSAKDDVEWSANGVSSLTHDLAPAAPSSLPPDEVTTALLAHIRSAPPAFDPFAAEG